MDAYPQNSVFSDSFFGSKYLNPVYLFNQFIAWMDKYLNFIQSGGVENSVHIFKNILFVFALFFLTMICYIAVRMYEIRKKEHRHLQHEIYEYAHHQAEREQKKREQENISENEKWVQTLHYLFSPNAGDWKLAIIEADAMLETLLEQLGFMGATLGDKLKAADPAKFRSLPVAWEVHTIRNRIAHEGTAFLLSQHEAKRVIALYESIFRQYGFI